AVGADVREVVLGMGYDRRIGFEFLKPGPGFGGSCFPKDTLALIRIAEEAGYEFDLLKGVVTVNDEQFDRVVAKVERMAGGSVDGRLVAAWGLTFKARTDDLRGSPAVEVLHRLQQRGARIRAYDPAVTEAVDGLEGAADPYGACEGATVLLVLTEWGGFRVCRARRHQLRPCQWFCRRSDALRQPGVADRLSRAPDQDPEGRKLGHSQDPRLGQGQGRPLHARLDQRGLRRPPGPPADRGLLGTCQSRGTARRLRRSQALRRGHDD